MITWTLSTWLTAVSAAILIAGTVVWAGRNS